MEKRELIFLTSLIILTVLLITVGKITGRAIDIYSSEANHIGPSIGEQKCMSDCIEINCEERDMNCIEETSGKCSSQCNIETNSTEKNTNSSVESKPGVVTKIVNFFKGLFG